MTDLHRERVLEFLDRAQEVAREHPTATVQELIDGMRRNIERGDFDVPNVQRAPVGETQPRVFPARGPDTSFDAAALHTGAKVREKYLAIHGVVRTATRTLRRGMTDDEIAEVLSHWNRDTVRNRRVALAQAGWLRDTGTRRPGHSGSPMIVWEAME